MVLGPPARLPPDFPVVSAISFPCQPLKAGPMHLGQCCLTGARAAGAVPRARPGPWDTRSDAHAGTGQADLQGIGLGEADLGPPLGACPQVVDLGGDVAEGQVADHHFLLHLGWLDAPGLAAVPCCPRDLEEEWAGLAVSPCQTWKRSQVQAPGGLGYLFGSPWVFVLLGISATNPRDRFPPLLGSEGPPWGRWGPPPRASAAQPTRDTAPAYVVLTQHHALGAAGGAGRVHEHTALAGLLGVDDGVQVLLGHLLPQLHDLLHLRPGGKSRPSGSAARTQTGGPAGRPGPLPVPCTRPPSSPQGVLGRSLLPSGGAGFSGSVLAGRRNGVSLKIVTSGEEPHLWVSVCLADSGNGRCLPQVKVTNGERSMGMSQWMSSWPPTAPLQVVPT